MLAISFFLANFGEIFALFNSKTLLYKSFILIMALKKIVTALIFGALINILVACSPTPSELADEYRKVNAKLETETDSAKRNDIFAELSSIEYNARNTFSPDEFKEYARLAHPDTDESSN